MRTRHRGEAGFTLFEMVMAVAILGISLSVLLQSQSQSLRNAGRARDMTVAALLARGKMIDIERHLFHDGFQMGAEDEEGEFRDEGHPEVHWHYRISEVEFDLSSLMSICGSLGSKAAAVKAPTAGEPSSEGIEGTSCETMLGTISAMLGGFTDQMGRSLRTVELTVNWPEGKFKQSMQVRALLSRDDFTTEQNGEMLRGASEQAGQSGRPGGGALQVPQ